MCLFALFGGYQRMISIIYNTRLDMWDSVYQTKMANQPCRSVTSVGKTNEIYIFNQWTRAGRNRAKHVKRVE